MRVVKWWKKINLDVPVDDSGCEIESKDGDFDPVYWAAINSDTENDMGWCPECKEPVDLEGDVDVQGCYNKCSQCGTRIED